MNLSQTLICGYFMNEIKLLDGKITLYGWFPSEEFPVAHFKLSGRLYYRHIRFVNNPDIVGRINLAYYYKQKTASYHWALTPTWHYMFVHDSIENEYMSELKEFLEQFSYSKNTPFNLLEAEGEALKLADDYLIRFDLFAIFKNL